MPYMGALAAAGCTWSARGDLGYSGKWAGLARRCRCTPRSWAQWAVRVQWGLSERACKLTGGILTLQFKPQSRFTRFWLVIIIKKKIQIVSNSQN